MVGKIEPTPCPLTTAYALCVTCAWPRVINKIKEEKSFPPDPFLLKSTLTILALKTLIPRSLGLRASRASRGSALVLF